jgi:hypothetical protein
MPSVTKHGFAEFVFSDENISRIGARPGKVDLVNPAIVGFSEDEFSLVMVDTNGENPSYVGITRAGDYVVLSPASGNRQLLQRAGTEAPSEDTVGLYKDVIYRRYVEQRQQVRTLSILFFFAVLASVSGLYVIWPVLRATINQGGASISGAIAAVLCAILVFFSVRILHQTIRSIILN